MTFTTGAKRYAIAFFDIAALGFSVIVAFWLRLGWPIDTEYITFLETYLVPFILVKLGIFYAFGMYRRLWRYASIQELRIIVQAVFVSSFTVLFLSYLLGTVPIPRTVFIVDGLIVLITVGGIRLSSRTLAEIKLYGQATAGARRILIIGAGDAGAMLVKEMLKNPALGFLPIGLIDDDPHKKHMKVHGTPVLGTNRELKQTIEALAPDEVIIAMPSVGRPVKEKVVNVCKQAGVRCRTLPGIYEIIDGRVGIGQIRDIQIEDILGRDPVTVNIDEISRFIKGKTILVTGAGGSIGSELCRQVSYFKPSLLVMVDIAENSLFEIDQELREKDACPLIALVGDVKDEGRMDEVLQAYHPHIIFHAAAYKHVPMMEMNPKAALENNFIGTAILAEAATRHRVKKFVLISTDKAVNPINIMGTSKALAERAVLSLVSSQTQFVVVRFGNVLASRGSVVPIFQKQIAAGGPITVTHPEMKRYLMTITESVQLVLQAAVFGGAGDVFMLDMGEQVSIVELAAKLIRLSGLTPDQIEIKFVGVRPGEKMEEALVASTEQQSPSSHPKIIRLRDSSIEPSALSVQLLELEELVKQGQMRPAFAKIGAIIPQAEHAAALSNIRKMAVGGSSPRDKESVS